MKRFKEKTVIITGADSDIGRAIALKFAQEGANCIIVGINNDILEYIYEELPEDHTWINTGNHFTVTSDINDPSQTKRLVEHVLEKYKHIDVMINIDTAFGIHQSVIPELTKTKGNIVNVSTLTEIPVDWTVETYRAEQKKLTDITKKLALENIPNNVRINAVTAGLVTTDISSNPFVTHSPLAKTATPLDVAAAVLFLASDDAAIITGINLPVDGGVSTFTE